MAAGKKLLGDILVDAGLVTRQQLLKALEVQQSSGLRLGEVLVAMGMVSEHDVARAVAEQMQITFVPEHEVRVDLRLVALIPMVLARQKQVLPVGEQDGRVQLAMVDPMDVFTLDEVRFLTGRAVDPVVITPQAMHRALTQWERLSALRRRDGEGEAVARQQPLPEADDAPVVQLVDELIDRAVTDRASDIHIEPMENAFRVRLRVDGHLHEVMRPELAYHPSVVARLKVMAGLDIAERRAPQDGRIELRDRGRNVDVRVATLPTIYGEKVVLRLFDKSKALIKLTDLGMNEAMLAAYRQAAAHPHGMILVTGPTGSGKTTTLIATLDHLNAPQKNIVTVEDPVEYQLAGVNHVQVNQRAGVTFATGLRSILRQDPNVIMVGEIRDRETADIAVRAALTGHLVLSTLHTNDAPGALTRLVDMGIEPFLIASSVHAVLAQRLVRRLCTQCRVPVAAEAACVSLPAGGTELAAICAAATRGPGAELYQAVGCPACRGTGYSGRLPVFELLTVSPAVREQVNLRQSAAVLREIATQEGMQSLLSNGLTKVAAGLTTVEEVLRVAQLEE